MNVAPLFLLFLSAPTNNTADWPQLHGPSGDRRCDARVDPAALTEPAVAWRVETPRGFSSFAVSDGRAITLVAREGRETCVAFDVGDGGELWSRSLGAAQYDSGGDSGEPSNKGGDGPRSTPVIADGRVYVYDAYLVLTCLDAGSGEVVWRRDVLADHEGRKVRWQNASAPVLVDDRVLVAGGGAGQSLLAFAAADGALRWKSGDEHLTHATPIVATLGGVRQVIFYLRRGLVSVDPASGVELWRIDYDFRTSSAASPVVWEDVVYVSAGYGVGAGAWRITRAEDAFHPELLWRKRNKLMNHWSTPVCRDGFLYGMFGFKDYGDGPLACVELATGEERWSEAGFGPGNVILAGDDLIALTDAGQVVLVEASPEAYREKARAALLDGKCWSSPALAGDQLYVRSTTQGVRLDLAKR